MILADIFEYNSEWRSLWFIGTLTAVKTKTNTIFLPQVNLTIHTHSSVLLNTTPSFTSCVYTLYSAVVQVEGNTREEIGQILRQFPQ